jgi:hypothetical protein
MRLGIIRRGEGVKVSLLSVLLSLIGRASVGCELAWKGRMTGRWKIRRRVDRCWQMRVRRGHRLLRVAVVLWILR